MLSATSQYALRALAQLAALPKGKSLLGRELAERCSIPPHYLTNIFVVLRNAGLVVASRGRDGGYHLNRRPAGIFLVDVVGLFEEVEVSPACLLYPGRPCGENPCSAHKGWRKAQQSYSAFLNTTTIASLSAHSAHTHGNGSGRSSKRRHSFKEKHP